MQDKPARIGDDDPRNGASSLQKFDGEDLGVGVRIASQKKQQAEWADRQCAEKKAIQVCLCPLRVCPLVRVMDVLSSLH